MRAQGRMLLLLLLLLLCPMLEKPGELRSRIRQNGGDGGVRGTRRPAEAHLLTPTQDRVRTARRQVRSHGPCEKPRRRPGGKRSPQLPPLLPHRSQDHRQEAALK